MKVKARLIAEVVLISALLAFLAYGLAEQAPAHDQLREYIVVHAVNETGSVNLVTSIYLCYRAFDTLGETIVLLLAVAGIAVFKEGKP
jgi:multicomponent Na+:H+ antiporter subunit B